MLAAFTGLRASEIASTSRASFKLSKTQPIVTVKAAYTKNSKLARIPLESGLVVQLKMYFKNIQRDEDRSGLATGTRQLRIWSVEI